MEKYIEYITSFLPDERRNEIKFHKCNNISIAKVNMLLGGSSIASQKFYHIIMLNEDPPRLFENKRTVYFHRNRLIMLPPGREFAIQGALADCDHYYYLVIKRELVDEIVNDFFGSPLALDVIQSNINVYAMDIIGQIEKEIIEKKIGYEAIVKYYLSLLMSKILREFETNKRIGVGGIAKACEYIADNFHTEISIEELARIANISKFHFIRQFKLITGSPPYQYVKNIRLKKGYELLLTTNISISAIAKMCGFLSTSHFSSEIKSTFGKPPTLLRNSKLK